MLPNHVIVIDTIGEITQDLEKFLIQKKAAKNTNYMFRFLTSYSTFCIFMFGIGLLLGGISHGMPGARILFWIVPIIPFAFLGCQAIIYKSDFSPGPYYGSAIGAILSIALPYGAFWNYAGGGFDCGWLSGGLLFGFIYHWL